MPRGIYRHPPQCGFQKGNKLYLKRTLSKEAKKSIGLKNSKNLKGRKLSEITKNKISKALIGIKRVDANENQLKVLSAGRKIAIERIRTNHPDCKGIKNPFYGKHHKKETWNKIRCPKGWKHTKEAKKKISDCQLADKHWNWKGGISKEPYGLDWTYQLKNKVKHQNGNKCQICGLNKYLCVHHMDENKKNNRLENLTVFCRPCHTKFHNNKEFRRRIIPCLN